MKKMRLRPVNLLREMHQVSGRAATCLDPGLFHPKTRPPLLDLLFPKAEGGRETGKEGSRTEGKMLKEKGEFRQGWSLVKG